MGMAFLKQSFSVIFLLEVIIMKIKKRFWNKLSQEERQNFLSRSEIDIAQVQDKVQAIIDKVRLEGDQALLHYNHLFDKSPLSMELRVSQDEIDQAVNSLDPELKKAMDYSIENIRRFHEAQRPEAMSLMEIRPGILAGEKSSPIDSVGLYVPRGRGSFPSMLYMLAVPAQVAGVPRICLVTPPDQDGNLDGATLYGAKQCGVTEIYKVGGAQAIAALALGTESIAPVVKLTGPGSMYVTAAKRLLYSQVDVGLPAGPSESILICDEDANPWKAALDILVEAEHGSDSSALLLTPSEDLADKVIPLMEEMIEEMPEPRKTFLRDVFKGYGGVLITESMEEACEVSNLYAPEHLQIHSRDPFYTLSLIRNAGEIMLGDHTPFSSANYSIGSNAVLPTGGKAKTYSAVSVRDFIKYSSVIQVTPQGHEDMKWAVTTLADYEGFPAHSQALKRREER